MKRLVVFFSRAGENYVSGSLKQLEVGNTEIVADMLANITGADKFKVEPVVPYSEDYNECIAQAKEDQRNNTRPKIKAGSDSIDEYDVIYIGYPNYWGTMPMHMFTFLEKYDFSGKEIKPFCTHEGSGMGRSESDIKQMLKTANVKKGLAIHGTRVNECEKALKEWA